LAEADERVSDKLTMIKQKNDLYMMEPLRIKHGAES